MMPAKSKGVTVVDFPEADSGEPTIERFSSGFNPGE
jgi:hypothetical protein